MALDQHGTLLKMVVMVSQHHFTGRPCWSWLSWFICLSSRLWGLSLEGVDKGCHKGVQTRHDLFKDLGCDLTLVQQLVFANAVSSIHGKLLLGPIRFFQTTEGTHI